MRPSVSVLAARPWTWGRRLHVLFLCYTAALLSWSKQIDNNNNQTAIDFKVMRCLSGLKSAFDDSVKHVLILKTWKNWCDFLEKVMRLLLLTERLKSNCATHWATMCLTLIWSLRTTLCWGLGFFWPWHLPWLVLPFRAVHQKTHRRGNISEWLSPVYDYLRLWSTFVEQHWDISITLSTANKNSTFEIFGKRLNR